MLVGKGWWSACGELVRICSLLVRNYDMLIVCGERNCHQAYLLMRVVVRVLISCGCHMTFLTHDRFAL